MKRFEGTLGIILTIVAVVTTVCSGIGVCETAVRGQARLEGQLAGKVIDELGAVIGGATVVLLDSSGNPKKTVTDERGGYSFERLGPGAYSLRVNATGFATFERGDVTISSSRRELLDVKLTATIAEQKVSVAAGAAHLGVDPAANANAIVIKGKDLDALPDDPDELASALQALAGPAAGPSGGQLFIDGFLGGRAP
ncbi:MAG TPA: carboxypeptidase-like regulatory domain-containing protein, partial [Blastocatellia bacterium]|nr:carboxypeptidase-like regulatory domain-containing protein [Blastocatellia bacterium]